VTTEAMQFERGMLNIFYGEPEGDRWIPLDRYPRRVVRRLVRGKPRPGGHMRVFINLCAGLDRIGARYRINDYQYIKKNPDELACIIGKPCVLDKLEWKGPILFGSAGYSHPIDDICLLQRRPITKVLVPGLWMKEMCKPYWGAAVEAWPVGIDTELWRPSTNAKKEIDVLLYNKIRWMHNHREWTLLEPIRAFLGRNGYTFRELHYGSYREEEFHFALGQSKAMLFICEHETQGIAYQQALSCGVPIFAWDHGGHWEDPNYYPEKVQFSPVSSVPYWDSRCGSRFQNLADFEAKWSDFWQTAAASGFSPREYILDNLTLESCARSYLEIVNAAVLMMGSQQGAQSTL
jgi:hypothetical protein